MKQNPYRKPTPTRLLRTEYTEELRLMEPENKPITDHQRQINKPIKHNLRQTNKPIRPSKYKQDQYDPGPWKHQPFKLIILVSSRLICLRLKTYCTSTIVT